MVNNNVGIKKCRWIFASQCQEIPCTMHIMLQSITEMVDRYTVSMDIGQPWCRAVHQICFSVSLNTPHQSNET